MQNSKKTNAKSKAKQSKKRAAKKPPVTAAKKQATPKGKNTSKHSKEKLNVIQRFIAQLKALIFRKKYKERDEFRYNNLTGHPNYNFEESNGKVKGFGVTHSEETFGIKNMPLKRNPKKGDTRPAFIRNGVISEKSKYFSENVLPDFELAPEDEPNVKSKKRNYKKRRKQNKKSKQARR